MKPFIIGISAFLLSLMFYSFLHDFIQNRQAYSELRIACEEASAAAALFSNTEYYSDGYVAFNQQEAHKAIKAILSNMLRLDDTLLPSPGSYWQSQVKYSAYFMDDSNTIYPYSFIDPETGFEYLVTEPTVIVTVDAGEARYSLNLLQSLGRSNIRSAAHTWKER